MSNEVRPKLKVYAVFSVGRFAVGLAIVQAFNRHEAMRLADALPDMEDDVDYLNPTKVEVLPLEPMLPMESPQVITHMEGGS